MTATPSYGSRHEEANPAHRRVSSFEEILDLTDVAIMDIEMVRLQITLNSSYFSLDKFHARNYLDEYKQIRESLFLFGIEWMLLLEYFLF